MRRVIKYRYSIRSGVYAYPPKLWLYLRRGYRPFAVVAVILIYIFSLGTHTPLFKGMKPTDYSVAGQNYEICNEQAQYLTSPWTYDSLASGTQTYDVAEYEALPGYGTTLPSLPSYIAAESPTTTAAVIFAPGSTPNGPAYDYPESPIIYYFEGGSYGVLGLESISGDEFIGGSAPGFPEPEFNDGGGADGIDAGNGSYYYSGGSSTLAATANIGDTTITTTTAIPGYIQYLTFSDGTTYQLINNTGTTITLGSSLTNAESSGSTVWANSQLPLGYVAAPASQGASSFTMSSSSIPLVPYGKIVIGADDYEITSVSGSQSGYTIDVNGLDTAITANTPIYYNTYNGDVTVQYLNINDDQHNTTGTIYTGAGWTITNNDIHDGYSTPGQGVAIYGGDNSTIEYNCLSKMGDYGVNIFGTNNKFDYNEVYESNYEPDPGCGCSGGGKWWGTLNADIVDNAFINDSPGGGGPVWLDNGNSGTFISGNLFDMSYGSAISSETGFNLDVTDNLFENGGWGNGSGGCGGNNCAGAVNINSSGGFNVPGSRYENQISITNNNFINNWEGIDVWQAGGRSCQNSGEGWPDDAAYCSGGFPNSSTVASGSQYNFSHIGDSLHGESLTLDQNASSGSSTILVRGDVAIDDQVGFSDPLSTTTTDTTDVSTFNGSGTVNAATTTGFPTSGELRVGTSQAWSNGQGSFTGAILSYTGTTVNSFTGVSLVNGSGTLSGPLLQVQPYKVTNETCYSNDCAASITPALASNESSGATITNAGTCQLFATSSATPSSPLAPDGTSYWDGCQWESRDISVTGNNFVVQPSVMSSIPPLNGGTTQCTPANFCGQNFMADQFNSGELPFNTEIGSNAMMSSSTFTGCPAWDSGCTTNPLANLNAGPNPPGASVNNGEAPYNDVWSSNTYSGPWTWTAYIFGNCFGGGVFMPSDLTTGNSLTGSACADTFPQWQADWQQDSGSTYNPLVVNLHGLNANQEIYGPSQSIGAFEDTISPNTINSTLSVNGTNTSTLNSGPYNFSLNTLDYHDGPYTLKVSGTDSGSNTNSDSQTVYISNGDLNGDGRVNISDLAIMAAHWGQTDSNYGDGNITGQSKIGISDLAVMAGNWDWVQ